MKVLAINGSPNGKNGCTEKMLQPLLSGMQDAGAVTDTIYLVDKKIHHCIGCFSCWLKTPGKCVFDDDMHLLIKRLVDIDMMILASPLYYFSMTGLLKNFLDRTLPLNLPFMYKGKDGRVKHPSRYASKEKRIMLLSSCGFPELANFDSLVSTVKQIVDASNNKYIGEILKPAAAISMGDQYFNLLKLTGRELIEDGKIDEKTYLKLHESHMDVDEFCVNANRYFQSQLDKISIN